MKKQIAVFAFLLLGIGTLQAQRNSMPYNWGFGLRAGFTSGLTAKHFYSTNSALEYMVGWHKDNEGPKVTALHVWHKALAQTLDLYFEYGVGLHAGYFDRLAYGKPMLNFDQPMYNDFVTLDGKRALQIGATGIIGLEFQLDEAPISISLDVMPVFDFMYFNRQFIDGSLSVRWFFK